MQRVPTTDRDETFLPLAIRMDFSQMMGRRQLEPLPYGGSTEMRVSTRQGKRWLGARKQTKMESSSAECYVSESG